MAKIFSAPSTIPKPNFNFSDIKGSRLAEEEYLKKLKDVLVKHNNGAHEEVGEILQFPHADGYAMYMVGSMKPLSLVHLEIGDCWEFPYIERLTVKDVENKIKQQNALAKLFSK